MIPALGDHSALAAVEGQQSQAGVGAVSSVKGVAVGTEHGLALVLWTRLQGCTCLSRRVSYAASDIVVCPFYCRSSPPPPLRDQGARVGTLAGGLDISHQRWLDSWGE